MKKYILLINKLCEVLSERIFFLNPFWITVLDQRSGWLRLPPLRPDSSCVCPYRRPRLRRPPYVLLWKMGRLTHRTQELNKDILCTVDGRDYPVWCEREKNSKKKCSRKIKYQLILYKVLCLFIYVFSLHIVFKYMNVDLKSFHTLVNFSQIVQITFFNYLLLIL